MKKLEDIVVEHGVEHTLEEIAEVFGVRKETIRQTEAKALMKLRHPSRSKYIKDCIGGVPVDQLTTSGKVRRKKSLEQLEEWIPKYWRRVL